jgi:hypothetical protein
MTTRTTWSDETRQAIEAACRAVRETPIGDGRTVWDLLTDERSRQAVAVAERYAAGDATDEEMRAAARGAARAAWANTNVAQDAAWVAALAAADEEAAQAWAARAERYAAWAAACYAR